MTMGHIPDGGRRPFKPTGKGGGSEPGKPQSYWPLVILVIAHAIVERAKGTGDSWKVDRSNPFGSIALFGECMDKVAPGWKAYYAAIAGFRATALEVLLYNRVYKQHYSGTSDRGVGHNILTRANDSRELWALKVPIGSPLYILHKDLVAGRILVVKDWKAYL